MLRPMSGLIERYRDRLPFAAGDPVVSLQEGSTPLVLAPRLSERVGAEVWLKIEGANPTGSFKDRGMTCAVSAAVREGAKAIVCASTGNTAASAAAYAARAGLRGVVIVPEGRIAAGKLAQALMHGAQVLALRGNFDQALALVRRARPAPSHLTGQLGQRVPDRGAEDGLLRDRRGPGRRARRPVPPGG
jgi:threonine synthase